jgi:two-component system response regulator AtoC
MIRTLTPLGTQIANLPTGMETIYQVFFSASPKMEKLNTVIGEIADVDVPVLIKGESGTGKEVLAQAIHLRSQRQDKPLIKVNCAAIPKTLLESELFGFDKGAFTGAHLKKPGKFELANGGTIILNDIGEIDISIQAKLLQVLQDGEFSRLGGEGDIKVDTRVITTTKDDLEKSISEGRFREDLFFRINVISLTAPPLRERREQILPLARFFYDTNRQKYGKPAQPLSPKTLQYFQEYDWPGNVRELENLVKRIILFGEEEVIRGPLRNHSLARAVPAAPPALQTDESPKMMRSLTLKRVGKEAAEFAEREFIERALQETHWNRKEAAKVLQISYKALLYKIKKYRLNETKNIRKLREELGWPIQLENR